MTFEERKAQIDTDFHSGLITEEEAKQQIVEAYIALRSSDVYNNNILDTIGLTEYRNELPDVDYKSTPSVDLEGLLDPRAKEELRKRDEISEQGFIQQLTNPDGRDRFIRQMGKAPGQIYNAFTTGLPAIASLGIDEITSGEISPVTKNLLEEVTNKNQHLNERFNVSDPVDPVESLAESVLGAVVPGGLFAKGLGLAGDFALDQGVRELTDVDVDNYETILDQVGLPETEALGPLAAIGAGMAATTLGSVAVNKMITSRMDAPPVIRPVKEIDPTGPNNLDTIERASDLTNTYIVDEQAVLKNIAKRAGVPDQEDVEALIDLNTHSAARTRAAEGLQTGKLTTNKATFDAPIAPQTLYNAYHSLDPKQKHDVGTYIHLLDMRDDALLALKENKPGNHQQQIAILNRQIAAIAQRNPVAVQFQKDYMSITNAARRFLEDGIFTKSFRKKLDLDRPNYVPLRISDVDENAPFLQRMAQANNDDAQIRDDWFLQKRDSTGNYDVLRRDDPLDMLMNYLNSALLLRMKNDTKLGYIDGLLSSEHGSTTIRKVVKEDGQEVAGRTVEVYRNGVKEKYVTSRLVSDLLQFDPYIAKYPALFIPKRIAEQTMVGPLSITFAPVTMLRDALGGAVTRPQGVNVGDPFQVLSAVPKQLLAKSQKAFADSLKAKLITDTSAITKFVDKKSVERVADDVANSYMNTLYHMMNEQGGFDASLMKSNVQVASGSLQELKRTIGNLTDNPVMNNMITRFGKNRVVNMIDGFTALFSSIQDAPRFAAVENTVKSGMDTATAVRQGRSITGDVSRSGRVFQADGSRIKSDATNQGLLNALNPVTGHLTEIVRESAPFINPMIQGTRRLLQSYADDPIGTNLRAWTYVGLPSLAAYGWNEMVGKEYNDYAMQRRSARDVAMNLYVAIPDRPPEEGVEIPLMHELLFYSSPLMRTLYGWSRGENSRETALSMEVLADSILSNSLDIGFPIAPAAGLNAMGMNAPDSLVKANEGLYPIREDHIGFLPQNIEVLIRTLFSSIGQMAIETAYTVAEDPDNYEAWMDDIVTNTVSRAPITKNISGSKKANIWFSIPAQVHRQKMEKYDEFVEYYREYFMGSRYSDDRLDGLTREDLARMRKPETIWEDRLSKPSGRDPYDTKGSYDEERDLPFRMVGPKQMALPTNPIYQQFGGLIYSGISRNGLGWLGIKERLNGYSKINRQLRRYSTVDKDEIKAWEKKLKDHRETLAGDDAKLLKLLEDHNIDLDDYYSRVKLINIIENERSLLLRSQQAVLEYIEQFITKELRNRGQLGEGQEFKIDKHLEPFDSNPLGSTPNSDGPLTVP